MAARPSSAPISAQTLRTEVLKELQLLVESKEARDRIDRGPLAEAKGREHWVLHLLLRAFEADQNHVNQLVGSAYSNTLARLQAQEDRLGRLQEAQRALDADLQARFETLENTLSQKLTTGLESALQQISQTVAGALTESLDKKWKPVSESVDNFAQGSKQILKDVADTYRVATQTRLLLNENARRITDLGRDLIALEESLKLVVAKTMEEALAGGETRPAAIPASPTVANGPARAAPAAAAPAADAPPETEP